jgi:uncharacterized membrane protein
MATAEGDYTGSTRGKVEDNSLGRLLTLSDGVFAIAMTLLALDLRVPELPDPVTNTALLDELGRELPSILTFLLSFYVVANYWFSHHRLMRSVTTTHPRLLRHTLPLLLVVAAMPFPTSLLGRYASVPIALALYSVVNVLAVLLLLWLRHDVESFRLATAPVDPDEWRRFGWELRGNLVVFLLCIPAGYVLGGKGPYVLALLFFSNRAAPAWRRWQRRGSE